MKATLALVGCGPRLEVALWGPGMPAPALVALAGPTPRSDLIMGAVDLVLRAAGLESRELGSVLATRGPGSFTGIRVTLATAQGLVLALDIAGRGVSSLLVQAQRAECDECLALQPARRGFVYAQRFRRNGARSEPTEDPSVIAVADLVHLRIPVVAPTGLTLQAGVALAPVGMTAAEALLGLRDDQDTADIASLTPIYLEPPPAHPPTGTTKPWPPSPKTS